MRAVKYKELSLPSAGGASLALSYFFLSETLDGREHYGVQITEETRGERAAIPGLTTDVRRIRRLMDTLVQNSVTPTTLADIVADWL